MYVIQYLSMLDIKTRRFMCMNEIIVQETGWKQNPKQKVL